MKANTYHAKWWQVAVMTMTMLVFGATAGHALPLPGNPVPGMALDPTIIPKYVQPLVIPPVMPKSVAGAIPGQPDADYNIAVRQFKQQILPGGIWNAVNNRTDNFGATTIWSYGRAEDNVPAGFTAPVPLDPASPLGLLGQGSSFNYPAFTIEALSQTTGVGNVPTKIRWINDLVDANGDYLPHLFKVDQTLHWANPAQGLCRDGSSRTDCSTDNPVPYTGPVPIVTHVHGSHVNPESDGYPEAWWLPGANNIPAGYANNGTIYTQYDNTNTVPGSAFYAYENDQPPTTLWYHDHSLGMTRLNVYAGPAGFYLLRNGGYAGGLYDGGLDRFTGMSATLPGPAPVDGAGDPNFDPTYRASIHEIPIVIQDRSFNNDGSLFYPESREFFDGLKVPYIGDAQGSDMAPIWNPEAFFNTMVVNGTTWPQLDVDPIRYRFRLLNGCNSRFLNLAMFQVDPATGMTTPIELPFYQIGGDQGFLPQVVEVMTGSQTPVNAAIVNILLAELVKVKTALDNEIAKNTASYNKEITKLTTKMNATANPKKKVKLQAKIAKLTAKRDAKIASLTAKRDAKIAKLVAKRDAKIARLVAKLNTKAFAKKVPGPSPLQAMLMAPAERADVIVDFSGLAPGTIIRMVNTGPDAPFGGFPAAPVADPGTTGQVMQFVVSGNLVTDNTTSPALLALNAEPANPNVPAIARPLSLNEEESWQVCALADPFGAWVVDANGNAFTQSLPSPAPDAAAAFNACASFVNNTGFPGTYIPFAPKAALLGDFDPATGLTTAKLWSSAPMVVPLGNTEDWEIYNFTVDGHPIHLHLVRYQVVNREAMNFDPVTGAYLGLSGILRLPELNEAGFKDTVIAYPGEVTRIRATFDRAGRYVWHCHIVEHEDNEMMLPYLVQ